MNDHCACDVMSTPFAINIEKRRSHEDIFCDECSGRIVEGEQYCYIEGDWFFGERIYYQCEFCARVREDIEDMGWCPWFGRLWEYIDKQVEE